MEKKEYVIRFQKMGSNKVNKKTCHTGNISALVHVLGSYGYHIISYYENTDGEIKMVNMGG
jgi:hypothetical protein